MRVNIEVQEELAEPHAIIYTPFLCEQVQDAVRLLSNTASGENRLVLQDQDKYVLIRPEDIFMVRFKDNRVVLYTEKRKYLSSQRLYQVEEELSPAFIRISKTTIVNTKYLESIEPSFNGTMLLKMQNDLSDYISRKYLPAFKRCIGL